ncbi:oligoribonuclease isoform X2 [Hevea brasiliensis]|uniref:oligoribonuclease isoform X2 n=1 Tax=Hevea brasiliensis TaxID=3981 RepID=UPI0025F35017|nr:oligoribonuclease isoform X2 [Hevea brasiliensis]
MDRLSNTFSVLDLDAEDDQVDAVLTSSVSTSTSSFRDKPDSTNKKEPSRNIVNGSLSSVLIENGKQNEQNLVTSAVDYKMPLVWIDMEMTGLNIEVDRILEIACIITDGNLTKSVEGPDLVIHQSKECLEKMGEWCQSHHAASGLTEKVLQSSVSEGEAEKQVIEFVRRHVGTYTPLLAGNSVYVDFLFLKIRRKPLQRKTNIEPWMILERALES